MHLNDDFKLTDDKFSVNKITCLTSGIYFTDKEIISPGEEQISQTQNLFLQVRNKSHNPGIYFTRHLRHLKELRLCNLAYAAEAIESDEEEELFNSKAFETGNLDSLLAAIWYLNTTNFGLRGFHVHRQLKWGDVTQATEWHENPTDLNSKLNTVEAATFNKRDKNSLHL
ncbi:unnamed protein product [Mytilus coruscus]|uniref:Uncharacterized protein n=1 Tax=Mytilus coruscus TaxID=42192 RepID=A0A6J8EWL7_MYTCO|nr:unnamed protein product [Mytilus coruscus]